MNMIWADIEWGQTTKVANGVRKCAGQCEVLERDGLNHPVARDSGNNSASDTLVMAPRWLATEWVELCCTDELCDGVDPTIIQLKIFEHFIVCCSSPCRERMWCWGCELVFDWIKSEKWGIVSVWWAVVVDFFMGSDTVNFSLWQFRPRNSHWLRFYIISWCIVEQEM